MSISDSTLSRGGRDALATAPAKVRAGRGSALRRGLLLAAVVAGFLPGARAAAQSCPGVGDCCSAHATPACQDAACCDQVCAIDGFCCLSSWDASCANTALVVCGAESCGGPVCPGPGDCCADNGTPACDDVVCCELVCAQDGFCCSSNWDQTCVAEAASLCSPSSCSGATCVGIGDCCTENGSPSCEDESCCAQVCAQDAFCCDTLWDAQCATLAQSLCAGICSGPVPAPVPVLSGPGRILLAPLLLGIGSAPLAARQRRKRQHGR